MSERESMISKVGEEAAAEDNDNTKSTNTEAAKCAAASRKERRKAAKKEKRKNKRKEMAEMARREEEARLNDPEEQLRLQAEEEQEKLRAEKERKEFEERERKLLEAWERKEIEEREELEKRRVEEEERQSKQGQVGDENEMGEDGWEYVEEGPPEIIWQGNEIIVKKKRVRVKKKDSDQQLGKEDPSRPTSNPLPPQSEVFADYENASTLSAQQLLENVAQETPNFGTEQDKAHCPFHLKTGACRFGSHCSRIHFYPDKSCTLLIKHMYHGPGLAWEQDEGLEYTDEEIERAYEEFYEDVHTEFLKFGEIVNFKVCKNGSSHLRGNVYIHYKSLDSAVLSYQSVNGRYFAGKQLQCEFVGVTRWKVAICGEFMKSKLQTCSRGVTCNFIHCFRNPGGDYEWADWDKPPPKYWQNKMAALFGYSDEAVNNKTIEQGSPRSFRNSRRTLTVDADRTHSREIDCSRISRYCIEDDPRNSEPRWRKHSEDSYSPNSREKRRRYTTIDCDSDRSRLDRKGARHSSSYLCPDNHHSRSRTSTRHREICGHSTSSSAGQQKTLSMSPDDRWDFGGAATYDSDLTGDWSDGERESAHGHTEESPMSDGCEEFEHKRSKRQRARLHSIRGDRLSRGNGESEHNCGRPSNSRRSYGVSESSSKYDLESGESKKQFCDHLKKSERRRGTIQTRSLTSEKREESSDDRGRWEPENHSSVC